MIKLIIIFLLTLFLLNTVLIAQSNTQPTPSLTPSISQENSNTSLSNNETIESKTNQLLEYQLAEKVEQRVLKNLIFYGTILVVALAVISFLGFSFIWESLANRVEKSVTEKIEKEVNSLKTRIQDSLIELQVSVKESQKILENAKQQLDEYNTRYSELENLGRKYISLYKDVTEVSLQIEKGILSATQTITKTNDSANAPVKLSISKPVITGSGFNWNDTGSITGKNFGNEVGKIYLTLREVLMNKTSGKKNKTKELLNLSLTSKSIISWDDNEVRIKLNAKDKKQATEIHQYAAKKYKERNLNLETEPSFEFIYVIETQDGRRSAPSL